MMVMMMMMKRRRTPWNDASLDMLLLVKIR